MSHCQPSLIRVHLSLLGLMTFSSLGCVATHHHGVQLGPNPAERWSQLNDSESIPTLERIVAGSNSDHFAEETDAVAKAITEDRSTTAAFDQLRALRESQSSQLPKAIQGEQCLSDRETGRIRTAKMPQSSSMPVVQYPDLDTIPTLGGWSAELSIRDF